MARDPLTHNAFLDAHNGAEWEEYKVAVHLAINKLSSVTDGKAAWKRKELLLKRVGGRAKEHFEKLKQKIIASAEDTDRLAERMIDGIVRIAESSNAVAQNSNAVARETASGAFEVLRKVTSRQKRTRIIDLVYTSDDDDADPSYTSSEGCASSDDSSQYSDQMSTISTLRRQRSAMGNTPLPSGKILEDLTLDIAERMERESPFHSFVVDVEELPGKLMDLQDLDHIKKIWKDKVEYEQYFNLDSLTSKELQQCISFLLFLEQEFETGSFMRPREMRDVMFTHRQTLGSVEPLYDNLLQVILAFLNNCERPENTNTREAYFVREWDSIFRTLTPPCVVLSPPEEVVAASKERKLQQAEPDATHVHERKADLLWQTCSGLSLVWGEAKKGSWAANPKEADQAKLKVVKGVKDMIDHVQRHKSVVVPLWASVNLATSWTLRKAAKLDTGVVLIGDICRYDLPREFMQFPVLIDMCKTLLIWGQVMTMTTRKIGLAGRLHGGSRTPPRLPVMVRTFQTPNTKDTAKEPLSKKCKRSEESEST